MKMLWVLMPLILIMSMLVLLIRYPYVLLGYLLGFLIAPSVLRKTGIYHVDVSNSIGVFVLKDQEMKQLEAIYQNELYKSTEKRRSKERRLQRKIQRLQQETKQLDKTYTELLDGKPDRIIYVQPRSFLQLLKNRLLYQERG